jgi:hypothetical protein
MMDRNPYSPPQTDVREIVEPDPAGPRPARVALAVRLFWIEFALSVVQVGLDLYGASDGLARFAAVVAALLSLPAEAWVIYKIARRRNWARFVALGAVIISALLWLGAIRQGISADPVTGIMGAVELVIDGIALYLLFTNPGSQWFK